MTSCASAVDTHAGFGCQSAHSVFPDFPRACKDLLVWMTGRGVTIYALSAIMSVLQRPLCCAAMEAGGHGSGDLSNRGLNTAEQRL